jgi:hypothetical protein
MCDHEWAATAVQVMLKRLMNFTALEYERRADELRRLIG